jgi:hypothetical protein
MKAFSIHRLLLPLPPKRFRTNQIQILKKYKNLSGYFLRCWEKQESVVTVIKRMDKLLASPATIEFIYNSYPNRSITMTVKEV